MAVLQYSQVKAISLPDENGWIRPYDWLPMPAVVNNSQVFHGLCAVFPQEGNFIAVRASGAYTVNWGDGTSQNAGSNTTAQKNYAFSDLPANTLTSRGYRQALITITPQSGNNLTAIDLVQKHSQSGLINGNSTGLLDIVVNSPNLTTIGTGGNVGATQKHRYLERAIFSQSGTVTSLLRAFFQFNNLQSVILSNTSSVTNLQALFQGTNLVTAPSFNTSNATDVSSLFNGNTNLREIPAYNFSAISSAANMVGFVSGCTNLARSQVTGLRFAHSYTSCALGRDALVEIFNNLGTASGSQTITITGNFGAGSLTTQDRAIATNKGWTITG